MIWLLDLDERRSDFERLLVSLALCSSLGAGVFFYVTIDRVWVCGGFQGSYDLLIDAILLGLAFLLCLRFLGQTRSRGRIIEIDFEMRSYRVAIGASRRRTLWSGPFDDFADVRLARKVRRIYLVRHQRWGEFWTISLTWKDEDRRPVCLQEFGGHLPPPNPGPLSAKQQGTFDQAQASLSRWGSDLGVPAIDETLEPAESG